MSGQPHYNFLNVPNFGMLNPQNTQIPQMYEKAIKDAIRSVQLQKLGKKQLQQIAKELNIPEKKKKEEIISLIPKSLLQITIQVDPSRLIEQLLQHQPNLQNNEIIMSILKQLQASITNRTSQFQQQPQMRGAVNIQQILPNLYNPSLNYMVLPQSQQAQQQLLAQYPQLMNMNLYQQQLRQNPQQQFYYQYNNQWNDPLVVPQTEIQQLLMCPCKINPSKRVTNEEVKCINCDNKLHVSCLKLQPNDVKMFECPVCILSKIDPLNQIIKVLTKPTLMNPTSQTLNFVLNTEEFHQLQDRSFQYQIELRSIRLDAKYINEITWPDFCEILINQNRLIEFKPLKSNSSLKKRKDEIQIIPLSNTNLTLSIKSGYNQITIKEGQNYQEPKSQFKLCEDAVYAQAIYLTKKRPHQELINQIKQNKECIKIKEDCVQLIQKACVAEKTDNDVQIDKITVKASLKCQFDYQMIQTPARGRFCTHVQCFSLENTITINAGTSRKWKCPVCKKKIFDIMIDQYQLQLLEQYRKNKENIKEVVFDQNGEIVQLIKEELEESEEEQISLNKQNQLEEQHKQVQQQLNDPFLSYLLLNPAAAVMQFYQKQMGTALQQQQIQQQQLQQKEKNENINSSQNKAQLKQLVESNLTNIEGKQNSLQSQLSSQAITKPKFIKFKKFETWLDEISQQEIAQKNLEKQINDQLNEDQQILEQKQQQQEQIDYQQQQDQQQQQQQQQQLQQQQLQQQQQQQQQGTHQENDKPIQKSNRLKERMVRVIKKQFSEFIRKNFANNINATTTENNTKNPQQAQQQQSATKKYIYKFSEEKPKINTSVQFTKMLADQIIMQNPGQIEKQHEDLKALGEEQLKPLQAFLPQGFTTPQSKQQESNVSIQKALSNQNPPIMQQQQQQPQQQQQQMQQQVPQQKIKDKPLQKIKSPQPSSNHEEKNGKDVENPICID